MKEGIAAGVFLVPFAAIAQQVPSNNKTDSLKNKKALISASRIITFGQMDQRKIYHWENGQTSTPTGREAGEFLSGYVKIFGDDSAEVVSGPVKKR